ncbi:hypothetical protein FS749_007408 [Ceratobasidium sp. UAMH 11750]|nr:hypothetical protein FS749_007408 [Ceratobasidium sp. UAMH 11750]
MGAAEGLRRRKTAPKEGGAPTTSPEMVWGRTPAGSRRPYFAFPPAPSEIPHRPCQPLAKSSSSSLCREPSVA